MVRMSIVVKRTAHLAILLFLAGVLAALAPRQANAHNGAHHQSATAGAHAQSSPVSVLPAAEARSTECPDGPGHVCSCGNLSLCSNGSNPLVPISHPWS